MQQPLLCVSSCRLPLKLSFFVCIAALPWPFSRTSIAARVAASNTSSTPWFSNEEHSKYALAPSALDIRSPYKYNPIDQNKAGGGDCSQIVTSTYSTKFSGLSIPFCRAFSRISVLHPTRITGILWPHIDLTSSIHYAHLQEDHWSDAIGKRVKCSRYLVGNVIQTIGCVHAESDQDDMCFGITQRSQAFVFLLACCVPQL
jgi:hypothetical protein